MEQQQNVATQQKPSAWDFGPSRHDIHTSLICISQMAESRLHWHMYSMALTAADGRLASAADIKSFRLLDEADTAARERLLSLH